MSIWPHVEERIVDLVEAHRSTIVFANSRRLAERLCARLNEIHAERLLGAERRPAPTPSRLAGAGDGAVRAPRAAPDRCSRAPTTARCPRSSAR